MQELKAAAACISYDHLLMENLQGYSAETQILDVFMYS